MEEPDSLAELFRLHQQRLRGERAAPATTSHVEPSGDPRLLAHLQAQAELCAKLTRIARRRDDSARP